MQLFLITNLLFYLAATVSHLSAFATKLQYHLSSSNLYGRSAYDLVQPLQKKGIRLVAFAQPFDELAHAYSQSLVFLFMPLLAGPLCLIFFQQRRYCVEWIMLSTDLFAGMLLVYAAMALQVLGVVFFSLIPPNFSQDGVLTMVMMTLTIPYVALFFRGAFPRQPGLWRWSKALAFTFCLPWPCLFPTAPCCFWSVTGRPIKPLFRPQAKKACCTTAAGPFACI